MLVSEQEIYRGMRFMMQEDRWIAEGASAVVYAALLAGKVRLNGPTAMIVTGRSVDSAQVAAVLAGDPIHLRATTVMPPRLMDY